MNIYDVSVESTEFFPVSGDELRRQTLREQNGGRSPRKEKATTDQCQIDMKDTEMSTNDSTKLIAEKSPSWAVPAKRLQFGTDVMHQGATRTLERVNADGDVYRFEVTPTQIEEIGAGMVTGRYFTIVSGGQGSVDTMFNVDEAELSTIADWFCSLVEKYQH